MKKILTFAAALLCFVEMFSQERVVERCYVSTDKDVYVAGDNIWCSVFCLDVASGHFSKISNIAYMELHSADGMAVTGKIALEDGRGGGKIALPNTLPTGNYKLIAYTSQNKDELEYDYEGIASKTISIFNAFSTERVAGGVEVVDAEKYDKALAEATSPSVCGNVTIRVGDSITVVNNGGSFASLSVSVFHDDGIVSNSNPTVVDFVNGTRSVGSRSFANALIPDYEGEVIRGHIVGFSQNTITDLIGKYAYISSPSDKSDVYSAPILDDGSVSFFTGNIYGDKECVCEIEGIDSTLNCHIELLSPFVNAAVGNPSPLLLSNSVADALTTRAVSMQIEKKFTSDTLFDLLPVRDNVLFDDDVVQYVLDDYTRFTTMEEIFIEFIPQIKARRTSDGKRDIKVRLEDSHNTSTFSRDQTLMMLDGIPVFDQDKIMAYDPLLVESVNIYPHTHFIGARIFEGVVNFVTYKHNLPSFKFSHNARVVDYQGVSYPMAYTCQGIDASSYPDYRQTIYWHPLVGVGAGESYSFKCAIPSYKGHFRVVVEGISATGEPIVATASFDVR